MKKRRIAFLAVFFAMAMAVFAASGTVYVTASGAKYHHRDCRTLAKSKNVYSMTVAEAQKKGYEPCKVCRP